MGYGQTAVLLQKMVLLPQDHLLLLQPLHTSLILPAIKGFKYKLHFNSISLIRKSVEYSTLQLTKSNGLNIMLLLLKKGSVAESMFLILLRKHD